DSFNLVLRAESASDGQGSVYGLFEVNGTSAEPFTPFEINKAVLEAIADMLEDHIEAMRERGPMGGTVKALVEFFGFDGVMFADSFGVSDTVVFTEENLTEVEDLRLVYGGVDADVENGTLRIVSRGDAVIGLGHLLQASRALVVANSVEINAGPVSFVRDFELEIESEEGTISVTIEAGSSLSGPAVIGVLGPDTALEILEESGVARALGALQVIGPAVDVTVEREIEAVMELEIPVDVPPDADSIYVVIVDDGEYELATDFEIEDGVLRIILDEFSTIVPVAVEEAAPPEETETTTTTPAQTETSPPPETTTPETTTPPPEETTPEETTTPPPEETTETTTPPPETTPIETTTPSPTTTPATTPMQETTPEKTTPMMEETTQTTPAETGTTPSPTETVEGEEGGLSGRDIAVIIAVIVMVAAALLLLRRR
ncbi:MAG: hypothetical protein LRS43_01335, partial [Desulfurococcales archaeon]|nr:hypothetical protein [Desulfurococcales archaeon]